LAFMKDLFLADAHLVDPSDENYLKLLEFLERQIGRIRTLYLLGDIFEFWIGYRHTVFAPYVPLLDTLRRLRGGGAEIVFVEGNHDFHLGPYFEEFLGCRILPDGGSVDIEGKKVFISHGDMINPEDRGYRLLRRILRSRLFRLVKGILPPDLAWRTARWASRQSKKGHGRKRSRWSPEDMILAHARHRFAEGFDAVVTGHFHAPFFKSSNEGIVIALGDWMTDYSYAVFENGMFSLKNLSEEG